MHSFVVLLRRGVTIPKAEWRDPACRRTLPPIDAEPILRRLWEAHHRQMPEQGFLEVSLDSEKATTIQPKTRAGIFDFDSSPDGAKVVLREEACSSLIGLPRRPTRQIGLLRPWRPLRILLNGRTGSYSGQFYHLLECHAMLCNEPMPDALGPTRLVDLQADLM
jgi:hypothetical protein